MPIKQLLKLMETRNKRYIAEQKERAKLEAEIEKARNRKR